MKVSGYSSPIRVGARAPQQRVRDKVAHEVYPILDPTRSTPAVDFLPRLDRDTAGP